MAREEPFDLRLVILAHCLPLNLTGNPWVAGDVHPVKEAGLPLEQPFVVLVPASFLAGSFI